MPHVFAGIRIERDDRAEEQVVAAAGAAQLCIPRSAVASADVEAVEVRIVGHRVPGGAAAAELPPLALPGLGGHLHGLVLEALGRVARHDVPAPQQLAGLGVVGGHVAADVAEVGTAVADDHLAVEDPRRAGDVAVVVGLGGERLPQELAAAGVECEQPPVLHARDDLAVPEGEAADAPGVVHLRRQDLRIVLPQDLATHRVHRVDHAETHGDVDHPVDLDRRARHVPLRQLEAPGEPEPRDVLAVDLIERAEALLTEGAPVGGPVVAVLLVGELRVIDVRRRQGRGGDRAGHAQRAQ